MICDAQKSFPDGCFTEDTHLILDEVAIRLNPGTPSRSNEPDSLTVRKKANSTYKKVIAKNIKWHPK